MFPCFIRKFWVGAVNCISDTSIRIKAESNQQVFSSYNIIASQVVVFSFFFGGGGGGGGGKEGSYYPLVRSL